MFPTVAATCQDHPVLPQIASLLLCCSGLISNTDAGSTLQLQDGDRIVLVGGTLIEREQKYGYWETALTLAYPDLNLHFRNLGWSGDTVFGEARARFGPPAEGYKLLQDQIRAAKPTVLLIAYGGNEAYDGPSGLTRFRTGLTHLLDDVAPLHARTVLLAPVLKIRTPVQVNDQILAYRSAIKQIASERKLAFADLLTSAAGQPEIPPAAWTDDGIQFNNTGYRESAQDFCRIFTQPSSTQPPVVKISAAGKQLPDRLAIPGAFSASGRQLRVVIEGLAPGRYRLLPDQPASPSDLASGTAEDWAKGVPVHLSGNVERVEKLRAEIIGKNVEYFNRYRPQNETYLFGFRKHEQGQNAREVPLFDGLVTEAEKRIAELRKAAKLTVILNRID
ncbi:hypothetical protein BH10PLA2_BH10PLA2_28950 [soil metagenome]